MFFDNGKPRRFTEYYKDCSKFFKKDEDEYEYFCGYYGDDNKIDHHIYDFGFRNEKPYYVKGFLSPNNLYTIYTDNSNSQISEYKNYGVVCRYDISRESEYYYKNKIDGDNLAKIYFNDKDVPSSYTLFKLDENAEYVFDEDGFPIEDSENKIKFAVK